MTYNPTLNDIPQDEGQVSQSYTPSLQDIPSSGNTSSVPEQRTSIYDKIMSAVDTINAAGQATATGMASFGTTLVKAASKTGDFVFGTDSSAGRKKVQSAYESMYNEMQSNAKEHPYATTGGFILGNVAATAGIPVGNAANVSGLFKGIASGAAQGAAIGATTTMPGQGDDVFNKQGAVTGGLFGGVVGGITGTLNKYGTSVDKYEAAKNSINQTINGKDVKFNGPMFDPTPEYTSGMTDDVLQKLPWRFGTGTYKQAEYNAAAPYIKDYINAVSNKTINESKNAIGDFLNKTGQKMQANYIQVWDDLAQSTKASGAQIYPEMTKVNADALLSSRRTSNLSTNLISQLETLSNPNLKAIKNPQDFLKFKQDVWKDYAYLAKRVGNGDATVAERETADLLRNTYFQAIDDYKNSIRSNPELMSKFNIANGFTKGYKELMDPQYNTKLVDAIEDINKSRRGVEDFIKWIMPASGKSSATERDVEVMAGVLGKPGMKAMENIKLRQLAADSGIKGILDNSLDAPTKSLNLVKFLDGLDQIKNSPQKVIMQDSLDALKGFRQLGSNLLSQHIEAQTTKFVNPAVGYGSVAVGAGVGSAAGSMVGTGALAGGAVGAAGIGITTAAMSAIKAYSPLKNALMLYHKYAADPIGLSPELRQYLNTKLLNTLYKAGVRYEIMQDGSGVRFDTNQPKDLLKTSMNTRNDSKYINPQDINPPEIPHEQYEDIVRSLDKGSDYAKGKSTTSYASRKSINNRLFG